MVHFKLEVVNRDSSIRVNGSIHSKAEDIFDRLERGFDFEFSKERLFLFESSLKSKIRDLLSGGVNLVVVVSSEFLVKDSLSLLDLGDIFSNTGTNEVILEPAIGSLDLASGLG
jgi:hypothetical protein